jgi:hypothetical protein
MNVKDMSTDEIQARIGEVTAEIDSIKLQLLNAKCRVHYDGTYADPDWFLALRLR